MFKNQLQELAQRSCFNLPSYASIREGPDHAPRFKASVNFNGELFESPSYSTTLRHAEHAAAEAALASLSARVPSKSLTARVLDETGIYKNLLQETAHRAGSKLPVYTTVRSGPGHAPVFTSSVEIAGFCFTGESAKTKKQAEKNAAISAWFSLKTIPNLGKNSKELDSNNRRYENGLIRRRDFQYQRGRMQRVQDQKRPWKFIDPRTGASAIKTMGSSRVEEDDNEWINKISGSGPWKMEGNFEEINKISEAIKKPAEGKSLHNKQTESGPSKMAENSNKIPEAVKEPGKVEDDNEWIINKISEAIKKQGEGKSVSFNQTGGGQSNFEGINKVSGKSVHNKQTESGPSKMVDNYELFNKISEAFRNFHGGNSSQVEEDDVNEWINKISEAIKKPAEGISIVDSVKCPVKFHQSSCSNRQMGMSQRFAPAVQIRSVIPVCAAPPPKEAVPAAAAELASTWTEIKL